MQICNITILPQLQPPKPVPRTRNSQPEAVALLLLKVSLSQTRKSQNHLMICSKYSGRNQRVSKPLALTLLSGMSDTTFFDLLLGHRRALHTGCQVGGGIRDEDVDGSVLRELLGVRSICSFARTLLRLSTRFQASVLCPGL